MEDGLFLAPSSAKSKGAYCCSLKYKGTQETQLPLGPFFLHPRAIQEEETRALLSQSGTVLTNSGYFVVYVLNIF